MTRSVSLTGAGVCLLDKLRPIPRHRIPAEIINRAVGCTTSSASLATSRLVLAERGVVVTHESIRHLSRNLVLSLPGGATRNADHNS